MTARTRYFVLSSLLVLAVGLGTGLVAYYVGQPGGLAGPTGPAELAFVPADAGLVAYANVREIMMSDVRRRVRRSLPVPEGGQREFQELTGIDIESDIDHVVVSLRPQSDGDTAGLLVARGRFADTRIESAMRQRGASVEDYKGKRLIVRQDGSPIGRQSFALSFLEPGLIAVGSPATVRTAIDLEQGGDNVTRNPGLMELVDSVEPGNAWVVGRLDALRSDGRLPADIAAKLPAITWFSVSGRIDNEVRGVVRADTRDEQAANDLRDVMRGFLALAKLQAGSRPELQTVLQSLELGGMGRNVTLSFAIPGDAFDALPERQLPRQ